MLNVTLVRLAPDARSADISFGQAGVVELSPEEFCERLEAFRELDPLQNAHADPEIRVQSGMQKYVVRTGQGMLFLYNVRDHTQPAQVLTTAEVLAELDGSANLARTAAPFPGILVGQAAMPEMAEIEELLPPPSPWRAVGWVAGIIVGLIVAWFGYSAWQERAVALPDWEAAALAESVEGVYLNGSAGERGIVIGREGGVRFFVDQGDQPPAIVFDSWHGTRREGVVRLELAAGQAPIEIVDRDTVRFDGETYQRALRP